MGGAQPGEGNIQRNLKNVFSLSIHFFCKVDTEKKKSFSVLEKYFVMSLLVHGKVYAVLRLFEQNFACLC